MKPTRSTQVLFILSVVRLLAPRAGVLEMRESFQGVNAYVVSYFALLVVMHHEQFTVFYLPVDVSSLSRIIISLIFLLRW